MAHAGSTTTGRCAGSRTALAPTTADALIDEIRGLLDSFGSGVDDDTAVLALGVPQ